MERVNVVVLASLVAALTLLGLRIVTEWAAPEFAAGVADASGPAIGPDSVNDRRLPRSRIALYGGPGEANPPPRGTPGAESRRESRRIAADQAEVIADLDRRRRIRYDAAFIDGVEIGDVEEPDDDDDLLAGRSAAIPRAGGGVEAPPQPDPEIVEEQPREPGGAEVLLRIPFDGDVVPEVGGGGFQTDGLVTGDGRVEFPEDAQLSFPSGGNVKSETGTISFEVEPHWSGADDSNNSFVQIRNEHDWENRLQIVKNEESLRFIIVDSAGVERNVNVPIEDWAAGDARNITAAWDQTSMRLYVDGNLVGQSTLPHPLQFADTTPMFIGSDFPGSAYVGAGGTISDFVVYGRALGADEIRTLN